MRYATRFDHVFNRRLAAQNPSDQVIPFLPLEKQDEITVKSQSDGERSFPAGLPIR